MKYTKITIKLSNFDTLVRKNFAKKLKTKVKCNSFRHTNILEKLQTARLK